ncbi:MAG: hypothetical protein JWR40_556 [Massilia sp.]|nr:hypothetical protein [Massilia sp.]
MVHVESSAGPAEPEDARELSAETIVWRQGDPTRKDAFFILVINNPALERPFNSGNFVPDLVGGPDSSDRSLFLDSARFVVDNLFGNTPGQAEKLLSDSPHANKIKVASMYVRGLVPSGATALVGEEDFTGTGLLVARRDVVPAFLRTLNVNPDIVFIVSNSPANTRASAWYTTDNDARPGDPFTYDGQRLFHRYFHLIPGMAALHTTSDALTAAHEFGHAFSSYTNGLITDLYVDGDPAFNRKTGRPIPDVFATYDGVAYASDKERDGLGYPPDWISYHPALVDPSQPALMDNFYYSDGYVTSKHDRITKRYILDRIEAKVFRRQRT